MPTPYLVTARATLTEPGLSLARVVGEASAPGVGLALSGGGTRAAVTALGVVRALRALGRFPSLRAVSAVSGGAWFSVPFFFLPERFDEDQFLGEHLRDPAALRWQGLNALAPMSFAGAVGSYELGTRGLFQGLVRDRVADVPSHRIWSRRVAEPLLAPFELASFADDFSPTDFFTQDAAAEAAIRRENPALAAFRCHRVRVSEALPRPLLIVGGALRVQADSGVSALAPVQFTPRFSGVMGRGCGALGGLEVGGGGVTSFAFNGAWESGAVDSMRIRQGAPLALSDVLGITSVYYGDALGDRDIHDFSPTLTYASPRWRPPAGAEGVYVDGGSVENTGVANLLAYRDIDRVIAVVSSPDPITRRGGDVVVERQVGALFGYREHNREHGGYCRYSDPGEGNPDYAENQVFSDARGEFLALTEAMGAREADGAPIVVEQTLEVVDNPKFAVVGGRRVRVLWVFLSPSRRWREQLHPSVRLRLPPSFPNIPTAVTRPPAGHISALAQFSGWMVEQRADAVDRFFSESAT